MKFNRIICKKQFFFIRILTIENYKNSENKVLKLENQKLNSIEKFRKYNIFLLFEF